MGALGRLAAVSLALLLAWTLASAAILAVSEEAEAVTVFFSKDAGTFALPGSVRLLEWDGRRGRFRGAEPGYISDLYRAGAILVIPARAMGCLSLARDPGAYSPAVGRE